MELQLVEEGRGRPGEEDAEIARSPSVQYDLDAGVPIVQASRAQVLRSQLRAIDAQLAVARSELRRRAVLRGPSAARHICDAEMAVGGCEGEFAEEEGVLCEDCGLFLCHACFGATVVANECQIGGRYDAVIGAGDACPCGSLPCPLFPQACGRGHIPLPVIQRALLDRSNRGVDGEAEDVTSAGHSPHKLHLLARQRVAEARLPDDVDGHAGFFENSLVRSLTDKRVISAVAVSADLARSQSGAQAALSQKQDELDQVTEELRLNPVTVDIPPPKQRTCAQCAAEFASFEGGQCLEMRKSHFLCNICFGGYLMKACAVGGSYEQEIRSPDGVVISARGCLPCPFFQGHTEPQLPPVDSGGKEEDGPPPARELAQIPEEGGGVGSPVNISGGSESKT